MQWDDYAQVLAACNAAHIALVESEATFATVQVRLREATMEGADDQVAYLEGRVTVLAPLVDRGTRAVAALVAEAEHRRDRALVTNVEAALAALTALVSMMERSLTLTPPQRPLWSASNGRQARCHRGSTRCASRRASWGCVCGRYNNLSQIPSPPARRRRKTKQLSLPAVRPHVASRGGVDDPPCSPAPYP